MLVLATSRGMFFPFFLLIPWGCGMAQALFEASKITSWKCTNELPFQMLGYVPNPHPPPSASGLQAGVEVSVFHWGCTRLEALSDDQRAHSFLHDERQNLSSLSRIFFEATPQTGLFFAMARFVPPIMRNKRHAGSWYNNEMMLVHCPLSYKKGLLNPIIGGH